MAITLLEHNMKVWEQKLIDERNEMFAKGKARGHERGRESTRELLRRQTAKRFDVETAARIAEHLRTIDDSARLIEVEELIVDCETAQELLSRLH